MKLIETFAYRIQRHDIWVGSAKKNWQKRVRTYVFNGVHYDRLKDAKAARAKFAGKMKNY